MSILARAHYARKWASNYEKFNVIYEKFNVILKPNYEKFNVNKEKLFGFLILKYYLCQNKLKVNYLLTNYYQH